MKKKGKKSEYFIKDIWIADSIWKDTQDCCHWVSEWSRSAVSDSLLPHGL